MSSVKSFYDKDFVPKSVDELYSSGWKEYMLYHIRKYSLNDVCHSPEDLLQDMMVQLCQTNYLEKFDPSICDFTCYLHTFIRNFMSKPYNKEHKTQNGPKIVNRASLVSSMDEANNVSDGTVVSHESIAGDKGDFTDYVCLIGSLEKDLAEIKSESKVEYNGQIINRDSSTVLKLLNAGYDVKTIAEIFGTSKQFVYGLRNNIKNVAGSYT